MIKLDKPRTTCLHETYFSAFVPYIIITMYTHYYLLNNLENCKNGSKNFFIYYDNIVLSIQEYIYKRE